MLLFWISVLYAKEKIAIMDFPNYRRHFFFGVAFNMLTFFKGQASLHQSRHP
jgi:hypothetical protein